MNIWNEAAHTISELLIHSLWVGAFVLFALLVILNGLPKRFAATRYALACAALFTIPILTLLTNGTSTFETTAETSSFSSYSESRFSSTNATTPPANHTPIVITLTWLVGALLSGIRSATSYFTMRGIADRAIPITEPSLARLLEELSRQLKVHKRVRLLMSHHVQSPVTFGWLKPVIIFPISMMSNIPPAHFGPIIAHELAHISRLDFLFSLVIRGVESSLFFHPAAWWISKIIREEREQSCDDLVTTKPYSLSEYAKALCWIDEQRNDLKSPTFSIAVDGTSLRPRIERLYSVNLNIQASSPLKRSFFPVLLAGILLLTLTAIGNSTSSKSQAGNSQNGINIESSIEAAQGLEQIILEKPIWSSKGIQGRRVPLFTSVPIIERDGKLHLPDDNSTPLFHHFPNSWVLTHRLDFLDSQLPHRDTDGDRFSNFEEYKGGTNPRDSESHPLLINKLSFKGLKSHNFTISYSAQPDEKTAQIKVTDHRYNRTESTFFTAGDVTDSGTLRIESISKIAVETTFMPTNKELTLPKNEPVSTSILYAEFRFEAKRLFVEVGKNFRIPEETDASYLLLSVAEDNCVIRLPNGEDRKITLSGQ